MVTPHAKAFHLGIGMTRAEAVVRRFAGEQRRSLCAPQFAARYKNNQPASYYSRRPINSVSEWIEVDVSLSSFFSPLRVGSGCRCTRGLPACSGCVRRARTAVSCDTDSCDVAAIRSSPDRSPRGRDGGCGPGLLPKRNRRARARRGRPYGGRRSRDPRTAAPPSRRSWRRRPFQR